MAALGARIDDDDGSKDEYGRTPDDGLETHSSREQEETEDSVLRCVALAHGSQGDSGLTLNRAQHVKYLSDMFEHLPAMFGCLDASRPWLAYWILHGLSILEALPNPEVLKRTTATLASFQAPEGGFSGGPGQMTHLAPTYAAVNALVTIGTEEALAVVDRAKLHSFLVKMKHPSGGFTMHEGGEVDVRGSYCALSAAFLTGTLTPQLKEGCADFIARCQTYEGGMGGEPGCEAHGGYTFCAYAALVLLGETHRVDRKRLMRWCAGSQMTLEGGFQGRANKLVDGCYSFWQGGLLPLLAKTLPVSTVVPIAEGQTTEVEFPPFDHAALQRFVLAACQDPNGGLRDKPSRRRDHYHSCYCLSGLSVAQSAAIAAGGEPIGPSSNKVAAVDAVLNVERKCAQRAVAFFAKLPPFTAS